MGSEICPVCGNRKSKTALSAYDCENCGFENAYIAYFAGEKSFAAWRANAEAAKKKRELQEIKEFASSARFTVGGNAFSFISQKDGTLYTVFGDGRVAEEKDVKQVSHSERNYAVLYKNGTVKVFGEDNTYSQKDTSSWAGISFVLTVPNCVYGVTESGDVLAAGVPASENIKFWRGIAKLSGGAEYIAALTRDGNVLAEGSLPDKSFYGTVSALKNVQAISASRNCLLALHTDGTVSFAGKTGDARSGAEAWREVLAIASDGSFAVGLTHEGQVLLAGACKPFLEKGRSAASSWQNIAAVSCNQSGIGALTKRGELLFAGTVSGDIEKMKNAWNGSIRGIIGA